VRDPASETIHWTPTIIRRRISTDIASSTTPTYVTTDAGNAYVKWPDNSQGPSALASELIGTKLAEWLGLETFRYHVFEAAPADAFPESTDETPVHVFATEEVHGEPWDQTDGLLSRIANPEDISWLVVLDTLMCNVDRFSVRERLGAVQAHSNPKNVFLSENADAGRFRLRVYDHTHCYFAVMDAPGGPDWRTKIQDPEIYGLFPEFKPYLVREEVRNACKKLATLDRETVQSIVDSVPREWIMQADSPINWVEFILERARFVSQTLELKLFPQRLIDYEDPS
jgi:hypothetical protein